MNYKHTIKALPALVLSCLAGCHWIQSERESVNSAEITPPVTEVKVLQSVDLLQIEDQYFRITGTSEKLDKISFQKPTADIRDLAAFSICAYRAKLAPVLKQDQCLKQSDYELIKFIIDTQLAAVKFFCDLEIANMRGKKLVPNGNETGDIERSENDLDILPGKFQDQFNYVKGQAFLNFMRNGNPFYTHLTSWSNNFQKIGRYNIERDLNNINLGKRENINDFQWRSILLYCDPTFITYICSKIWGFDTDLFEQKSLRPYKNFTLPDDKTSSEWHRLNTAFSFYIVDIQTIYDDIHSYIAKTKHSNEKRQLEDLMLCYEKQIRNVIRWYACVNTDFPFAVFCKKAYIEIQNCKGAYNDDENQMENVIHSFSQRVSGADMLVQLRSAYTAIIYVQFLELVKGELGDRWESVKTACKLYELDEFSKTFCGKNSIKQ